jgi:hypothetical protein
MYLASLLEEVCPIGRMLHFHFDVAILQIQAGLQDLHGGSEMFVRAAKAKDARQPRTWAKRSARAK